MTLRMNGSTSGYVELDCQATGGNNNIKLPSSNGSANQFLKNGSTAGTLGWSSLVEDSSGRLLVGTSSGSGNGLLHVQGTPSSATGAAEIYIKRGVAASSGSIAANSGIGYLGFSDSGSNLFAYIGCEADGTVSSATDLPGRIVFATTADGASSPTERMRITNNALVQATANIEVTTQSTGGGFSYSSTSSSTRWDFGNYVGQTPFYVRNGANGVQLNAGSTSWSTSSDERFKVDLQPITSGLEKVGTLRAVTGRYTTDAEDVSRSFLIAQDVQAVLPQAVEEAEDENKTLTLRYTEVIPLLVAALAESKDRIETLEASNAALEARLTALEAQS